MIKVKKFSELFEEYGSGDKPAGCGCKHTRKKRTPRRTKPIEITTEKCSKCGGHKPKRRKRKVSLKDLI